VIPEEKIQRTPHLYPNSLSGAISLLQNKVRLRQHTVIIDWMKWMEFEKHSTKTKGVLGKVGQKARLSMCSGIF
jgi:hypothetical protein